MSLFSIVSGCICTWLYIPCHRQLGLHLWSHLFYDHYSVFLFPDLFLDKTSPQAKRHLSSWLSWLSSLDNFHLLINFITGYLSSQNNHHHHWHLHLHLHHLHLHQFYHLYHLHLHLHQFHHLLSVCGQLEITKDKWKDKKTNVCLPNWPSCK